VSIDSLRRSFGGLLRSRNLRIVTLAVSSLSSPCLLSSSHIIQATLVSSLLFCIQASTPTYSTWSNTTWTKHYKLPKSLLGSWSSFTNLTYSQSEPHWRTSPASILCGENSYSASYGQRHPRRLSPASEEPADTCTLHISANWISCTTWMLRCILFPATYSSRD